MGASDNILAGLEGLFSGISSVAVPTILKRNEMTLAAELERKKQQEAARQARQTFAYELPQKEASAQRLSQVNVPTDISADLNIPAGNVDKELLPLYKARMEQMGKKNKEFITESEFRKRTALGERLSPDNFQIVQDDKESAIIQQKGLDLQKQLDVLKIAKEEFRNLHKGAYGKYKQVKGVVTGENPPERDWEDRRGALALSLWSAYTGERGKFSETDQELAFGLIPGVYEKGGIGKFDKAIRIAEIGIEAIKQGRQPPSIYRVIGEPSISAPPMPETTDSLTTTIQQQLPQGAKIKSIKRLD